MTPSTPEPIVDDVRMIEADTVLVKKLGGLPFDQIVSTGSIVAAEQVIVDASDSILTAVLGDLGRLQQIVSRLLVKEPAGALLDHVIAASFAIKSNAGLCGYPFASSLAKSLHVFCESDGVYGKPLTQRSLAIIRTHIDGLKTILSRKITGDGGAIGASILLELQKAAQLKAEFST